MAGSRSRQAPQRGEGRRTQGADKQTAKPGAGAPGLRAAVGLREIDADEVSRWIGPRRADALESRAATETEHPPSQPRALGRSPLASASEPAPAGSGRTSASAAALAPLSTRDRASLRGQAQRLEPIVQIGRHGLTPAVVAAIDAALSDHGLIKVRVLPSLDASRDALAAQIGARCGCAVVQRIGHALVLYRPTARDQGGGKQAGSRTRAREGAREKSSRGDASPPGKAHKDAAGRVSASRSTGVTKSARERSGHGSDDRARRPVEGGRGSRIGEEAGAERGDGTRVRPTRPSAAPSRARDGGTGRQDRARAGGQSGRVGSAAKGTSAASRGESRGAGGRGGRPAPRGASGRSGAGRGRR